MLLGPVQVWREELKLQGIIHASIECTQDGDKFIIAGCYFSDPLRGHSDYVAFEGPKHCVDSRLHFRVPTVARFWSARQDSNLRSLRS
jgi:hypothetical protein